MSAHDDGTARRPDLEAPGWDAVEARVRDRVADLADAEPSHWGTDTLPGQDGLSGISAYAAGELWLYVTFGLSELFDKVSDDPDTSGWGFELTLRLPRSDGEPPPTWPAAALRQLGQHVYSAAAPFAPGHRISTGPLPVDHAPEPITALAFAPDPELGEMTTPHGRVGFLAAVGITGTELGRMQETTTAEVVEELREASPLLVTGVRR